MAPSVTVIRMPVSVRGEDGAEQLFLYRHSGSPDTNAMYARSYAHVRAKVLPHRVVAMVRVLGWIRRKETRA